MTTEKITFKTPMHKFWFDFYQKKAKEFYSGDKRPFKRLYEPLDKQTFANLSKEEMGAIWKERTSSLHKI